MVKKIHLTLDEIMQKIKKLEADKQSEEFLNNKTKRRRIFQQLAKLQKAINNPEQHTIDPIEERERRQMDKQKRIHKKLARKKEADNYLKNQKRHQKRCLKCGSREHLMGECPHNKGGFCYKCGSQDHMHTECDKTEYALADCFYCGKKGHIARDCPDNQRGLYRKGGSCFGCGSVRHILKDCPVRHNKQVKSGVFHNHEQF